MLPERVIWTEGMGVSPVHFQQQDRYTDMQIRMRGALLSSHAWGFTEFVIDEQYLSLGKVVLSKAQGILPDGTLFEIGHGQQALSLDTTPGLTNRRVMLALPMSLESGAETRDNETAGLSTRYIRVGQRVRDHNAYKEKNSAETSILSGRLDLRLISVMQNSKSHLLRNLTAIVNCHVADDFSTPL